jgi:prepilin-type N-terminal cleavage/methylation domain-containing protein
MKARQVSRAGFSLIEILVAMAVLTMLMTFMFAMLGGTIRLWEQGNSQVEAAQAARIGLNKMAEDVQNAIATSASSTPPGGGTPIISTIPFLAESPAGSPRGWSSSEVQSAAGSDQLFGVRATGNPSNSFNEFGYTCVYVSKADGVNPMRGNRYFLAAHQVSSSSGDFFLRGAPSLAWANENSATSRRFPIIDNCVRLELLYASNNGTGITWTNTWGSQTNLPLGVLATVIAIDSRTAERVAQLNGGAALSAADISSITNGGAPLLGIQTLLRNGAVVLRRFIPFRNAE